MKTLLARVQRIFLVRFFLRVFTRFGKNNSGLLAAGLAFFMVLAFVPLLLVGLWALGQFYSHRPDEALHQIQTNIIPQIVPNGGASKEVTRFMTQAGIASTDGVHAGPALLKLLRGHGLAGILAILTAVWAAIQVFVNGSTAMNATWETTEKRNWVVLRLVALGLLLGVGVLLVASLIATGISTHISAQQWAHAVPFEGKMSSLGLELVAVLVSMAMYTLIYKFLPAAQVTWRAALMGGAFAAITWEIAKKALAVYLLKPNHSLYGDLGNLIVFVLWVLYSMTILLLGAEVSATYASEIEQRSVAQLKRAAMVTPAAGTDASAGSPLARSKQRSQAERQRKTGRQEGEQARRRPR